MKSPRKNWENVDREKLRERQLRQVRNYLAGTLVPQAVNELAAQGPLHASTSPSGPREPASASRRST